MLKRAWINRKYVIRTSFKWTGVIFAILGFIGIFAPLTEILSCDGKMLIRIAVSTGILFGVWLICTLIASIYVSKKRRFKAFDVSNGYHVYVQYGDVFDESEVVNPAERRNIVIPVNCCFDTKVDDDLVSRNTLHGRAILRLLSNGRYSEETLNEAIQRSLQQQGVEGTTITREAKRSGNLLRYPVGSVAEVSGSETETYFFLALSTFDPLLHAKTTNEDYARAIVKLIEYCNSRSQKYPVVLPLIGAGASETQKAETAILAYLIKTLEMHKDLINSDVHIVVRNSGKETIPIAET